MKNNKNIFIIKTPELKRITRGMKECSRFNKQDEKFSLWRFRKDCIEIITYNKFSAFFSKLEIENPKEEEVEVEILLPIFETPLWLSNKRHNIHLILEKNGLTIQDTRTTHSITIDKLEIEDLSKFYQLEEILNNTEKNKPNVESKYDGEILASAINTIKTPFSKRSEVLINIYNKDEPIYISGNNEKRIVMTL